MVGIVGLNRKEFMKTHLLMKALKEGKPLKLSVYSPGSEFMGNLIFTYSPKHFHFERLGFSCENFSNHELLCDVFLNPEQWKIASGLHDNREN